MSDREMSDADLGRHIVRLCQVRGMSRADLARRSGLTIEEIEEGWGAAPLLVMRKIAGAIGVPLSELFGEVGES